MKKTLLMGLILCSVFCLTACGKQNDLDNNLNNESNNNSSVKKNTLVCTSGNDTLETEGILNYLKYTIEYNEDGTKVTNFTYERFREYGDDEYNSFTDEDRLVKENSFKTFCGGVVDCETKWDSKTLSLTFALPREDELIDRYIKTVNTSKEEMKNYFENQMNDNRNWKCE